MNNKVSKETQEQALKMAKGTQKKGQTKEHTKLISQGIEKGIAEYKKQQSQKARDKDKQHKQKVKKQNKALEDNNEQKVTHPNANSDIYLNKTTLPWSLLVISWIGFLLYMVAI